MMDQQGQRLVPERKASFLLLLFYLWTFVLLGRPQDYLTAIRSLRPALVLGILTLVVLMMNYSRTAFKMSYNNTQIKLFFALVCLMIIGIPFSLYRRGSFMAVLDDYVMVVLFVYIFFIVINSVEELLTILFVGCLGAGLYSIFALISGGSLANRLQFGGVFDPNDLPFFTLSFMPFNLLFIARGGAIWKRLVCAVSFVASVAVMLQSGSRGGFLAFSAVFLMLFFTKRQTIKTSTKVLLFVSCAIFVLFNSSKIDLARYQSIADLQDDYNVNDESGRLSIWKMGMRAMLSRPFTGVGVGCFNEAVGRDREQRGLVSQKWQAPHNMLVQIGAETGVIGLFLFVVMSLNVFRTFGRGRKDSSSGEIMKISEVGRIGFLGHFISGMFLSHAYSIYWAFYIVLSAVVIRLMMKLEGK